jgi:hypothetical protein
MAKLIFIIGLCLATLASKAQQSDSKKDILKLMEVNGSAASYDLVYDQMVSQFKMMKPNVAQAVWDSAKGDVFDKEISYLKKDLIPVYEKNFTPEEVKQLIVFYTSPLGKKLVDGTTKISKESMQIAQPWGMSLAGKIQSYLAEKGM